MPRNLNPEAVGTLDLDCPTCGAPMEVIDRFTLPGVPTDVEHVKVRCIVGHWFTPPTDWLPATSSETERHNPRRRPMTRSASLPPD